MMTSADWYWQLRQREASKRTVMMPRGCGQRWKIQLIPSDINRPIFRHFGGCAEYGLIEEF